MATRVGLIPQHVRAILTHPQATRPTAARAATAPPRRAHRPGWTITASSVRCPASFRVGPLTPATMHRGQLSGRVCICVRRVERHGALDMRRLQEPRLHSHVLPVSLTPPCLLPWLIFCPFAAQAMCRIAQPPRPALAPAPAPPRQVRRVRQAGQAPPRRPHPRARRSSPRCAA